jgi:hypothetical protein
MAIKDLFTNQGAEIRDGVPYSALFGSGSYQMDVPQFVKMPLQGSNTWSIDPIVVG